MRSQVQYVTFARVRGAVQERAVDALDGLGSAVLLDVENARQRLEEGQPVRADPALELRRPQLAGELFRDGGGGEETRRGRPPPPGARAIFWGGGGGKKTSGGGRGGAPPPVSSDA